MNENLLFSRAKISGLEHDKMEHILLIVIP